MAKNITVRLAWHMNGWNGCVCKNPESNFYCIGEHSYPPDGRIRKERDLKKESEKQGKLVSNDENDEYTPPCIYSINAFGRNKIIKIKNVIAPPWEDRNSKKTREIEIDIPPATVFSWPDQEMYTDKINRCDNIYQRRIESAQNFLNELEKDKSLIFYYVNYSNPFSEKEKRQVLVGVSVFESFAGKDKVDDDSLFYFDKNKNDFVWIIPITSFYPKKGFRLPYEKYLDNSDFIDNIIVEPNNNFRYSLQKIRDDDALELIEKFIKSVNFLKQKGDSSENWDKILDWLNGLVGELWKNRGLYPGIFEVLEYIGFEKEVINNIKDSYKKSIELSEDRIKTEKELKDKIFKFLNSNHYNENKILDVQINQSKKIGEKWEKKSDDEKKLLENIFPRIDISKGQIENILAQDRDKNGIYSTLKEICENPYILSEEYVGDNRDDVITFNKIDNAVLPCYDDINLIKENDPRRLRALCVEVLKKENKHCFMPIEDVLNKVNQKLSLMSDKRKCKFSNEDIKNKNNEEILKGTLVFDKKDNDLYVYLKNVYEDEQLIVKNIKSLLENNNLNIETTKEDWQIISDRKLTEKQIEVCQKVFNKRISIITGQAGTGKTSIIKYIVKMLEEKGEHFELLAPTGKAADRLKEVTRKDSSTIHYFLAQNNWMNDNFTFKRRNGKVEIENCIIDEASMIDLELFAVLFRAIDFKNLKRLIIVGDHNQLPPIGRGKVFWDLINYFKERHNDSIGILSEIMRQGKKESSIIKLAGLFITGIDNNKQINIEEIKESKDEALKILSCKNFESEDEALKILSWKNFDELKDLLIKKIKEDFGKDLENNNETYKFDEKKPWCLLENFEKINGKIRDPYRFIIISPYRAKEIGIENINFIIQDMFYSPNLGGMGGVAGITLFDKVIQIRNNKYVINKYKNIKENIKVYNGEFGYVSYHIKDKYSWRRSNFRLKKFSVKFYKKDDYIPFSSDVESNLELAYAITVHKSQGSEFERVYLILPKIDNKDEFISKEMIYTAITRAKKHLTIFIQEGNNLNISTSSLNAINSSVYDFLLTK